MTIRISSIGTPGSGYDFTQSAPNDGASIDDLDPVYQQLFDGPITVTLATQASDRVQLNAMWLETSPDRRHLHINTARGRAKDRQMRATGTASVSAINPQNPYHWVTAYCTVADIIDESDSERGHLATESIDRLAKVYLGADTYPMRKVGEERVLFVLQPTKIVTFGAP
jgi:PPOX class probable F420-dependent enzyme